MARGVSGPLQGHCAGHLPRLEQLQEAADKLHLWAFMGNDKLHKRAFSIEKRMERIRTTDKPTKERRLDIKFGESEFRGDEVLTIKEL